MSRILAYAGAMALAFWHLVWLMARNLLGAYVDVTGLYGRNTARIVHAVHLEYSERYLKRTTDDTP